MSLSADFEKYARAHPQFHGDYRYPAIYYRAIAGIGGNYVDVGAGDGGKLKAAIEAGTLRAFRHLRAFDISAVRVEHLRKLIPDVIAAQADALKLPIADESIDFYYSDQVIEHVPDDGAMVREMWRVLASGARGVVGSVIKKPGAWYFYRNGGQWRIDPTHLREYASLDQFQQLFTAAGFEILEAVEEPLSFAAGDLLMRALLALRFVSAERLIVLKEHNRVLQALAKVSVRIPRYYLAYVSVRKA